MEFGLCLCLCVRVSCVPSHRGLLHSCRKIRKVCCCSSCIWLGVNIFSSSSSRACVLALCWAVFDCFSGSPHIVCTFDVAVCLYIYLFRVYGYILGLLAVCVCVWCWWRQVVWHFVLHARWSRSQWSRGKRVFLVERAHDFVRTNAVSKHRKEDGSYSKTYKRRLKDSERPLHANAYLLPSKPWI